MDLQIPQLDDAETPEKAGSGGRTWTDNGVPWAVGWRNADRVRDERRAASGRRTVAELPAGELSQSRDSDRRRLLSSSHPCLVMAPELDVAILTTGI